jgi:menaquinone-dependent protoporphyrinogen oxidase
MTALVCYATRHGATAGIAERIAAGLRRGGIEAECASVEDVESVAGYDAFVIGGAAYMFHWLKPATRFVKRNQTILGERPVWLFSSGPLGTDLVDEDGRDIFEVTRPKEMDELEALIDPVETRIFFGAWDPDAPPIGLGERVVRMMPAARKAMPSGDFRDWPAIDAWAAEIAAFLGAKPPAAT